MAKELKYGATLNGWETLLASLEANGGDFPQLETYRQQLTAMLVQAREATAAQAAMAASKQEASKRLRALLTDGRKLATFLRNGVRQRYGDRAEKLVEFNLQPFRGRPRKAVEVKGQPPKADTAPKPAQ
ncbi:MAG TPA: hypothetical protein VLE27_05335 [Thermoanaerobaculia bacterium]|nr:hypothetical protein [Thermoanaerobaculia bacterium]